MSGHVISHQGPHRKRAFRLGRFGALALTMAALAFASWIAPHVYRPAPLPQVSAPDQLIVALKAPPPPTLMKRLSEAAPPPVVEARRPHRPSRAGVPLDVEPGGTAEDFEVLSAAELESISQARSD